MPSPQSDLVRSRYARGTVVAAVAIAGGWHLAYNLSFTVVSWSEYRWPQLVAAAWVVYAAGVTVAARAELVGRPVRLPWLWCVVTLLTTAAVALAGPGLVLASANWGWGAAGWLAILLLWRRAFGELVAFLAANAAVSLGVLMLEGGGDRVSLARALIIVGGTVTLQLGFAGGARALQAAAGWAAAAAAAQAETVTAAQAAEQVHQARLGRYGAIQLSTSAMLADLASGAADPAEAGVRRRCAIQSARLRRLLVEHDDTPDPLVHELWACGDVAERRGVVVELSTAGSVPPLPEPVRAALAEPAIEALSVASSRARITVAATPDEVVVSVLADADADAGAGTGAGALAESAGCVTVQWHHIDGEVWVEARVATLSTGQPAATGQTAEPSI